jgi:hypothetical protein
VLTGLTGVGQWTRGLVFRCVLGSEDCVLVPRSNGTLVATWAWPTWVVSRRHVLEAGFILLEFASPSRRIFIGSLSLPPLWFAVSVLQPSLCVVPGRVWRCSWPSWSYIGTSLVSTGSSPGLGVQHRRASSCLRSNSWSRACLRLHVVLK